MSDILEAVEVAKVTGKIKKGVNEVTKTIEKGTAKVVVTATDCSPKEIIMHFPIICKEKNIPYFEVASKEDLGAAAGIGRSTAAVAIMKEGEAKGLIDDLTGAKQKKEVKAAPAEEAPAEESAEEKTE